MLKIIKRLSARQWMEFILIAVLVAALDQATKLLILQNFTLGQSVEVIPGVFNLVLTYNQGAAFGMLADFQDGVRQIVLGCTTVIALCVVFYFLLVEYRYDRIGRLALAMIFGGAAGNIIDRIRLGMVVDFLDFFYNQWHWPAFNIADSAICVAVFILVFHKPKRPAEVAASV